MDLTVARWKKSSYSNPSSNNCVEVATAPRSSAVRDTQHRHLGHLEFPAAEWAALLAAAKHGEL
ncbi:DUF397 domain-containing protein [Thermobifida cellulosilytica]|uniref:DUF397 domain-containing protein n=1 Tax=Thermobifida cellulosilytica TB100 TaxID=665004 RepID=A0A147KJV7_THECS|nr:DUF397 domain-containing protein [Thermobifida cellulosilytica]KUP97586.1 hypothetical protein AC529_05870 [Thermobifida cellulosilytica TB100]